jgi:uncharacterized membrane protein
MNIEHQKILVTDRIEEVIRQANDEEDFEKACILVGKVKGYIEMCVLLEIFTIEEISEISDKFSLARNKLDKRFKK